jgi:hypothetical protein
LLDDVTWDINGLAAMPGGTVQREGRYSWAYLVRRPRFSVPSVVDVSVVVYSGRSPVFLGENAYGGPVNANNPNGLVEFGTGNNIVVINWNPAAGQQKPTIRNGSWVLDATMGRRIKAGANDFFDPDPYGFFYRVVSVTEDPNANQMILELQTPIRSNTKVSQATSHLGVLVVLDNVVEVFEKGAGWQP